jgi:F-type H+-transporting ATPase subunit gamma
MASRQQIKSRISSVRNTRQITKAMQLVAASRMRRAQDAVQRTKRFALAARELLTSLRQQITVESYKLFVARPIKARLLIVVSSDRGLAGAYNTNILKLYLNELSQDEKEGVTSYTLVIGKKAAQLAARLSATTVVGAYQDFADQPNIEQLQPIVSQVLNLFESATVDAIDIIYTYYHSSVSQEVRRLRLLPAGFAETTSNAALRPTDFEPSPRLVLETAARRLIEVQLLQALLESAASEHSMRMMAMKNATDNATELADDLLLAYNNARQAAITQELAEITGGVEALNN